MTKEKPEYITEAELIKKRREMQNWYRDLVEEFREFGVEEDTQFIKVPITGKDGSRTVHWITKFSGSDPTKMEVKGLGAVDFREAVEAMIKLFPAMDKPSLKEAVLGLRKSKSSN